MAESIETFIQIENTQYQNQSQDSQRDKHKREAAAENDPVTG